ncbi:hypothetical protein MNY64_12030 [Moellerella wisconsensis]|uniref:hypothetical protein n=1 Tax=Moellerella wisconsensis TaxID=158849 RepID=UPI001F4D76A1|nr:hypothetical protein [Moellerella wisconsensis]UNH26575.1 hypothetical protein MNY64_12030 [Moellerella wisconsensis]
MKKISFFILLLLIPLINSGLYMLGIVIIWFLFCLLLSYKEIIHTKLYIGDYFFLFILILYGIITIILKPYTLYSLKINTYLVSMIYISIVYIFISLLREFDYDYIVKIFRYYLIILAATILLQWLTYFLTDDYIDFNKIFSFGESESRYTSLTFKTLGLIRPTAFFTEPSNASAIMTMITFCYLYLIKKIDRYVILGFIVSILTLSTAGVLIGSASLGVSLLFYSNKSKLRTILFKTLIISLCLIFIFYTISFSLERINNTSEYNMVATRTVVANIIQNQSWYNHLIGNGINILSSPIVIDGYDVHDYSFRDSGFFINLYYSFGLIGFVLFILWARLKIKNNIHLLIFFIILQSKFDYLQPVFWLLIFTISILNEKKLNHHGSIYSNTKLSY